MLSAPYNIVCSLTYLRNNMIKDSTWGVANTSKPWHKFIIEIPPVKHFPKFNTKLIFLSIIIKIFDLQVTVKMGCIVKTFWVDSLVGGSCICCFDGPYSLVVFQNKGLDKWKTNDSLQMCGSICWNCNSKQ